MFWATVFYADQEIQMRVLAGLAIALFSTDLLFSPTGEKSVIVQLLMWPVKDLWNTTAVVLCAYGIQQLMEEKQEERALWAAIGAVSCTLISPVYYYHDVNGKIGSGFRNLGAGIKKVLHFLIIRPVLFVYDALKYILLLKWMPGLKKRMSALGSYIYNTLDYYLLQYIRAAGRRIHASFVYWCYFHWWTDLKAVLKVWIGDPAVQKLRRIREKFIYVFGGYWLAPLAKYCGNVALDALKYMAAVGNQCAIAIGNSVIYPLLVLVYDQLKVATIYTYDIVGRPVVDALIKKYNIAEDFAFIYVLGPTANVVINSVPEKNPFCDDTDEDLKEFIPNAAESEFEDEQEDSDSDESLPPIDLPEKKKDLNISKATTDDLDDDSFLVNRLNRELSLSDSSDEEFLLFQRKERPRRRRKVQ
uniref:Transmembrane protein n=2 Tax=Bursaphelenchus xylophilus TaxID=6326 RepID=A0A1I7SQX6_BURXY